MADRARRPASERLITLDALRGFALLGILVPNIFTFAWPANAMFDVTLMGDTAPNRAALTIMDTVFLGKFMFLFAMMFGAGVVLYDQKTRDPDRPRLRDGWALWHRRCAVLLAFGMLHGYLLWYGDILAWYAVAGLTIVWWIRRLSVRTQIVLGLALYLVGFVLLGGLMALGVWALEAGHIERAELIPDTAPELVAYTGTFLESLRFRAGQTAVFQFLFGPLFMPALWGTMSLGMGLFRAGVLTGGRSTRFHAVFGVAMLALGAIATGSTFVMVQGLGLKAPAGFVWQAVAQLVGIPLSLGYSQVVVLAARSPFLRLPTRALANVGRMALTNYLSHTLICTTIFYGYGLGRFGAVDFPRLWGVVVGVWAFNLVFSAVWLKMFPTGPFEWLWRRLTYPRARAGGEGV